jgi:DNA-binding NtrC family response regulator
LTAATLCGDCAVAKIKPAQTLADHVAASERRRIIESLAVNRGRIAETAAQLGISRKNLWEKMKKHEIHAQSVEEI